MEWVKQMDILFPVPFTCVLQVNKLVFWFLPKILEHWGSHDLDIILGTDSHEIPAAS